MIEIKTMYKTYFVQQKKEPTLSILHSALSGSENCHQRKEEVDDIQIERDRSPNVLVIGVPFDQIIRVVNNVAAEDYRPQTSVYHHTYPTQRE